MKNNKTSNLTKNIRPRKEKRFFSEDARKSIVALIDSGQISRAQASRKYQVSKTSIHNWIVKYSKNYQPPLIKVVEHESDSKKNKELEAELSAAYEKLGRLQAQNMYLEEVIKLANEQLEIDLKKNCEKQS